MHPQVVQGATKRWGSKTLPQFVADMDVDTNSSAILRLFALTPDHMVLVVKIEGSGQAARAVFDLTRGAEN